MTTEHEAANRARKVAALVAVLRERGATAEQVRNLDQAGRRVAEQLAGVNLSSGATWAAVAATMEVAEEDERDAPDPFAGLV